MSKIKLLLDVVSDMRTSAGGPRRPAQISKRSDERLCENVRA